MAIASTLAVIVVALLGAVAVLIFIAVVAASVLVTGAVHIEEHKKTLTGRAPGPGTRLARRLLAMPDPPGRVPSRRRQPAGRPARQPARQLVRTGTGLDLDRAGLDSVNGHREGSRPEMWQPTDRTR